MQGISLTLDQYNTMMSVLPGVSAALGKKGEEVTMPDFGNAVKTKKAPEPPEDDEGDEEDCGQERRS